MDLGQIGEHCSLPGCRQLDFLPFRCSSCAKIFCSSHSSFDSHGCSEQVSEVRKTDPSSTLAKAGPCEVVECSKPRMVRFDLTEGASTTGVDVPCDVCGGHYCLQHRASHSCTPLPIDTSSKKATLSLIQNSFASPSSSRSTLASSSRAIPPPAKRAKKGSSALEFMRLKQFAKPGRGEVREREERWHLRIEVDLKAERQWRDPLKGQANKKLGGTYWKKDITVGQIQQATINNNSIPYNPVAGNASSMIHLIHIPPDDSPPRELASTAKISETVEDGAWLVLVKGSEWQAS